MQKEEMICRRRSSMETMLRITYKALLDVSRAKAMNWKPDLL